MASRTNSRVTRVAPNAHERQVIALLMLTGQQFDEFKILLFTNPKHHVENVFTAARTLQKYLALADCVPCNKRCMVMEIALMYESQLKKLIAELGESVMDSIEEINYVNEQTRERYLNRNWAVECNFMHTIFRTGSRKPIEKGTLSYLTLKSAALALSQPNHEEFELIDEQTWISQKEEPTLPTAPIINPPRKRRNSMVLTEEYPVKRLRTNGEKEAMRAMAVEDNTYVHDDIAFEVRSFIITLSIDELKETILPRFIHYCRADTAETSNGERWACSRNLRNRLTRNEEANESAIHEKCLEETFNDQSHFLAIRSSQMNKRNNPKFYREFWPIIPFEQSHKLI
ncbi:hypothetical protein PRIPAC_90750 [Pristionchus pacificus]|nr:hypothetical protein PRIPAC_90750 [Pristionchus pacificus]|eukprot:PDM62010.1 hypothetical protein PRIPAC_51452 [Pristionchus pacificus]